MNGVETACGEETRRRLVRDEDLNGFDYLEVSDDQRTLTVYFLGKAPEDLGTEHLRIDGGVRVRDVRITDLRVYREEDPELDDRAEIVVERPGDFSTYTLKAVEVDEDGRPTSEPRPDFDPRYAELDFTFKAGCSADLDCVEEPSCPPTVTPQIELNYLAKDYATFRQLILDRLALLIPEWRERSVPDIGIALVELMAYAGDHLSYYQDAVATEAYLDTARHRISVRRHARLVDYVLHEGCNARAFLVVETESDERVDPRETFFVTSFPGAPGSSRVLAATDLPTDGDAFEVFEPLVADPAQSISVYRAHNRIAFFTWGNRDCCLPLGATRATLVDAWADTGSDSPGHPESAAPPPSDEDSQTRPRALHLRPGDVLIFEEVLGPRTGLAEDADPSHRHAVRLTRVTPGRDPLSDQLLIDVEWAEDDALPFALCISTLGTATPTCAYLHDVSVARGNVILVDHGRTVSESLGQVEEASRHAVCEGEGRLGDVVLSAKPFRPILSRGPLVFRQGLPDGARRRLGDWPDEDGCGRPRLSPASALLRQDPRSATAQVWLRSPVTSSNGAGAATNGRNRGTADPCTRIWKRGARFVEWVAMPDLLGSRWRDHGFVVEVDDGGRAHLRFGDGDVGREPRPGDTFCARYRIALGSAGNVGAETINHVVFRERVEGTTLRVRNPMPAQGGVDPESMTEAKLLAPTAFRTVLRRAVTEDDYARLAERHPDVQRASAALRWTGSWYEAFVAVDPRGAPEPDDDLLDEVRSCLRPTRRVGHDLRVAPATSVPLDIELEVCVSPHHLRSDVRTALQRVFGVRDLLGGGRGLFHPDELTFGKAVYLSALVAAAQAVPGVESVSVTRLQRLHEPPRAEIEEGRLMLGPTEIARLDNDPARVENGVLRLELVGGR
jgi:hypothetical protein